MQEPKAIEDFFVKISDIIKSEYKNSFPGSEIKLQDSTSKVVKLKKNRKISFFTT